jgi:PTH2 family peptidyl-tRNA hydrolase
MINETKQVIIIRKDLKMRTGKAISQGAHASMGAILAAAQNTDQKNRDFLVVPLKGENGNLTSLGQWLNGLFKKITVYVNSEAELLALADKAKEAGLLHCLIQDSGLTEFGGIPTYTSLAIGPDMPERIDPLTGSLPLL